MNIPMKYEDVVAQLEAALAEVERLKNIDHRQILAESAAKYLLDSGAENFIGDVFTIEADDGLVKFEVIVTTQKIGAKSPGEVCSDLQQRLTVAEKRAGDAFEISAKWIDKRRDDYVNDHGSHDPETGTVEFPGNGEEYVGELTEIAEGLRALKPAAEGEGS